MRIGLGKILLQVPSPPRREDVPAPSSATLRRSTPVPDACFPHPPQEPDLLLLDEPTNHIDVETIEWLEGYLKGIEAPMVIVSHDREFLDQLCTKIVEVERGVVRAPPPLGT